MHDITMELTYGQIHCAACGDYVYDTDLENIAFENKINASVCKRRYVQLHQPLCNCAVAVNHLKSREI